MAPYKAVLFAPDGQRGTSGMTLNHRTDVYIQELIEESEEAIRTSLDDGEVFGIVDEEEGGVIAYVLATGYGEAWRRLVDLSRKVMAWEDVRQ